MYVELKLSEAQNANRSSITSITVEAVAAQVNTTVAMEIAALGTHLNSLADKRSIDAKANLVRCITTSTGLASSIYADPLSISKPMLAGGSLYEEIDFDTTSGGNTLLTVGTPLANNTNSMEYAGDWKNQSEMKEL